MSGEEIKALTDWLGLVPRLVCEAGVHGPNDCRAKAWPGVPWLLIEPLPHLAAMLRESFPKARVEECAIGPVSGRVPFASAGGCSHLVSESITPNSQHWGNREQVIEVESKAFAAIDPGNIDVLLADMEGAEWYLLATMRSRPRVIVLEMHSPGNRYQNPHHGLILCWMNAMGYTLAKVGDADCCWVRGIRV